VLASDTLAVSREGWPHLRQNFVPGVISAPQLVQGMLDMILK
jgi:hypothetical protein